MIAPPGGVLPGVTSPTVGRPSRRAYAMWLVALAAYVVAVFHRSSLGVAAVQAQERFATGASAVALFLVVQLAVYAALQVPVGVALDRFGSRWMIPFFSNARRWHITPFGERMPNASAVSRTVGPYPREKIFDRIKAYTSRCRSVIFWFVLPAMEHP